MSHGMTILAHRGNVNGPDPASENSLRSVRRALECGWGVEVDIRRGPNGRFYIAHDQRSTTRGLEADAYCALFRRHPSATVALNLKEIGHEAALLAYLDGQQVTSQSFLFDMELIESSPGATAQLLRRLHSTVHLASRVSDRREPLERALAATATDIIWLDEFDRLWASEDDVRRLKDAGRTVYAVSPELHGFSLAQARSRWLDFLRWGVDGVCTDYPDACARTCSEAAVVARAHLASIPGAVGAAHSHHGGVA